MKTKQHQYLWEPHPVLSHPHSGRTRNATSRGIRHALHLTPPSFCPQQPRQSAPRSQASNLYLSVETAIPPSLRKTLTNISAATEKKPHMVWYECDVRPYQVTISLVTATQQTPVLDALKNTAHRQYTQGDQHIFRGGSRCILLHSSNHTTFMPSSPQLILVSCTDCLCCPLNSQSHTSAQNMILELLEDVVFKSPSSRISISASQPVASGVAVGCRLAGPWKPTNQTV